MNDIRTNMPEKNSGTYDFMASRVAYALGMILCCMLHAVHGQRIDFTYKTYALEVDGDNVIQNAAHLDTFFESLYQLQLSSDRNINIVHIGDSHIQADYMTSVIRRNFHRHFGNGGRGLIVPLRVAGTNEPNNFKTASRVSWKSKRCVFPEQPLPIGIGGVTIETNNADGNLEIYMNDLWLDYSFNSLTLFYESDNKSYDFSIKETGGKELGRISANGQDSSGHMSVSWGKHVDAVNIQCVKSSRDQSHATIYGAVLANSQPGILYHTIGVNGAKFKHYNEASLFASHTSALRPDLFIISLGTNESIDYPYVDKTFPDHVHKLISTLREKNPLAAFILVTPQDVFQQKNKVNPGILQIREQLIRYAVDNGLAFYDMYRAMGGQDSAKSWTENALLSRDGIHLTRDGYEYQGNLFYHALMKGYNLYVPNRHP